MSNYILRLPQVIQKSGLSRSTIYLQISKGAFPHPITLGDRAVGWLESDIDSWIESRVKQCESAHAQDFVNTDDY